MGKAVAFLQLMLAGMWLPIMKKAGKQLGVGFRQVPVILTP